MLQGSEADGELVVELDPRTGTCYIAMKKWARTVASE
jgi:hypothetical protein